MKLGSTWDIFLIEMEKDGETALNTLKTKGLNSNQIKLIAILAMTSVMWSLAWSVVLQDNRPRRKG